MNDVRIVTMTKARPNIGARVRLIHCNDEWTRIEPGTEGTVTLVDDIGTVHVQWDDGHHLGLLAEDGDRWEDISISERRL